MLRTSEVTPHLVLQFAVFVEKADVSQLTAVAKFYSSHLVQVLKYSQLTCLPYSKCFLELTRVMAKRVDQEPKLMELFPQWENIFNRLSQNIHPSLLEQLSVQLEGNERPQKLVTSPTSQKLWQKHKQQNMGERRIPEPNFQCLGCSQFFYEGNNILHQNVTKTSILVIPSVKKIKMYGQELKSGLCGLVNDEGGVVLFACTQEKGRVLAKGQFVSQSTKESITQQILQIFEYFVPKLTFSANAYLSFVPVAKHPQGEEQTASQLQFKEGIYVARLRVWNNDRSRLIFYTMNNQLYLSVKSPSSGNLVTTQSLKGNSILKLLKKRFEQFYEPQSWGEKEVMMLKNKHDFYDHLCPQPLPGCKIAYEKSKDPGKSSEYQLQQMFSYVSVVLLSRVPLNKVITFLIAHKITRFQFYDPQRKQISLNSGVQLLFHDTSPYKLKQIFDRIEYSNSKPIFLMIDNAIKVKRKLTVPELQELWIFLFEINSEEELNYNEYRDSKVQESIVEALSKVSVFYLFMKLKAMGLSGSKLIRLDRMHQQITLEFSRKGGDEHN